MNYNIFGKIEHKKYFIFAYSDFFMGFSLNDEKPIWLMSYNPEFPKEIYHLGCKPERPWHSECKDYGDNTFLCKNCGSFLTKEMYRELKIQTVSFRLKNGL